MPQKKSSGRSRPGSAAAGTPSAAAPVSLPSAKQPAKKGTTSKTKAAAKGTGAVAPASAPPKAFAPLAPATAPPKAFAALAPAPAASASGVDAQLKRAEALLAAGDAEGALAIMQRLEDEQASTATAGSAQALKKASTVPAGLGSQPLPSTTLPRGGTLVKLHGLDKPSGLLNFNGRMGRVVEMMGKQYAEDGKTEICTVLLDSRQTDYDRSSGVWVGIPLANMRIQ